MRDPKRIGCVIMASGLGKRFGGGKLMADFAGVPMIGRMLDATTKIFDRRVVVTRHEEVRRFCQAQGVETVFHNLPGRNDTVRLGLDALGEVDGCVFCPGDQPLLRRDSVRALSEAWRKTPDYIIRLAYKSEAGAPVIFPDWTFSSLRTLPTGKGGGFVMAAHADMVRTVQVNDPAELLDADTPKELSALLDEYMRRI